MRSRDPAAPLMRALARRSGAGVTLRHDGMTPWSSATFVGHQHRVAVTGCTGWTAGLDEVELPLPGGFVASIDVTPTIDGAMLTVLVLDD